MTLLVKTVLFVLAVCGAVEAEKKILVTSEQHSSHWRPVYQIGEYFAKEKGYNVTLYIHDTELTALAGSSIPIRSLGAGKTKQQIDEVGEAVSGANLLDGARTITRLLHTAWIAEAETLLPVFQKEKPDLAIIDCLTIGAMAAAIVTNTPYVVTCPLLLNNGLTFGAPSYLPPVSSGLSPELSLQNRVTSLVMQLGVAYVEWSVGLPAKMDVFDKLGATEAQKAQYFDNHVTFVGTAAGFEYPVPLPHFVQLVGPFLDEQQTLTPALQTWIESSDKDVILISFGTTVKLTPKQIRVVLQTASNLFQWQVLWALPESQQGYLPEDLPSNLRVESFIPQYAVVKHPKVKVLVSQCGVASAHEALSAGKPLLCYPMFLDQHDVAARVVAAGAGVVLDSKEDFKQCLFTGFTMLLTINQTFTENAKKVSLLFKNAGGVPRAAQTIDTLLQLGNASALYTNSPYTNQSFLVLYNVDIMAALALIVLVVVWVFVKVVKRLFGGRGKGSSKEKLN